MFITAARSVLSTRAQSVVQSAPRIFIMYETGPNPSLTKMQLRPLGDLTNCLVSTYEETKDLQFQNKETGVAPNAPVSNVLQAESYRRDGDRIKKSSMRLSAPHIRNSEAKKAHEDTLEFRRQAGSVYTNIVTCSAHEVDIHDNLRSAEQSFLPQKLFGDVQEDITLNMRSILVDWLVEVSEEYKLLPDTLHLAVALLDRFLLLEAVSRKSLQLVGVSCMFIASKFEEIYAPEISDLCYITDNTYSEQNIIGMEKRILERLSFKINQPTVCTFLRYYASSGEITRYEELLSFYICELSLLDTSLARYAPSMIAAAAILLSCYITTRRSWSSTLRIKTNYDSMDLKSCVLQIASFVKIKAAPPCAIFEKYSDSKMENVVAELTNFSWEFPERFFSVQNVCLD